MHIVDFFLTYWILCTMAGLTVILAIWAKLNWGWVRFRAKVFRYSFPFIGTISSLSKDLNIRDGMVGWYNSEWKLCDEFHQHIRYIDAEEYENTKSYLRKAGDGGRTPTPFAIWILIVGLVVAEAYGFSYVLSGWAILNASEVTQKYGAIGIAFILSTVLVFLTHMAGHALHRNREVTRAIKSWEQDRSENKLHLPSIEEIDWEHDQTQDDHPTPSYAQKIARTGMDTSWGAPVAAGLLIVVVAIGATYVRGKALEESMGQETVGSMQVDGGQSKGASGNSFEQMQGEKNPLLENQKAADIQATKDLNKVHMEGGWSAFILLAIIFIFLQILAIFFGMKWGFIGKTSANAYRALGNGKFNAFRDFKDHYFDHRVRIVQGLLSSMQQKMKSHASTLGIQVTPTKSFLNFLDAQGEDERKRNEGESRRAKERKRGEHEEKMLMKKEKSIPPKATSTQAPSSTRTLSAQQDDSENEVYDGYSDKKRNKIIRKITLAELESLAAKGDIDDTCFVLRDGKWIKFGEVKIPELPIDDTPPLPD